MFTVRPLPRNLPTPVPYPLEDFPPPRARSVVYLTH
jgi:hypothetical protein